MPFKGVTSHRTWSKANRSSGSCEETKQSPSCACNCEFVEHYRKSQFRRWNSRHLKTLGEQTGRYYWPVLVQKIDVQRIVTSIRYYEIFEVQSLDNDLVTNKLSLLFWVANFQVTQLAPFQKSSTCLECPELITIRFSINKKKDDFASKNSRNYWTVFGSKIGG